MPEFILDVNVDLKPNQDNYPEFFFEAMRKSGRVALVVGGSDYRAEVKSKPALLDLIGQLITSGRVRSVPDARVDAAQNALVSRIDECFDACPSECDDPHIFALALVSGCNNVVTRDARMAACRNKIRNVVGHDHCADIRIIQDHAAFKLSK